MEHGSQQTVRHIERFIESLRGDQAEQLMQDRWLWNTMVIIVAPRC